MLNSNVKGAVAEHAIALAAAKLGLPVWRPTSDHSRADMVLEIGGQLFRVQCKWGRVNPQRDVIAVTIGGSWCSPSGYVLSKYTEDEIDLLAVYCGDLDRCFLLPAALVAGTGQIHLRLASIHRLWRS